MPHEHQNDTRQIRSARELAEYVETQTGRRGWGRGLRTAVSEWYLNQPVSKLATEVAPELARHRHIIRHAHPKPRTQAHNAFFQWVSTGELGHLATPEIRASELRTIEAVERLNETRDLHDAVRLIEDFQIPAELVPARWKESPRIWEALIGHMTPESLAANLQTLTDSGVLLDPIMNAIVSLRKEHGSPL